jgi:hypothetical protein
VRFVNLDNLGTRMVTYLRGEGMLFHHRAGAQFRNTRICSCRLPPSALGFEAISFLGKDAAGRMGNYHWHTDTFGNVDAEFLPFGQRFFLEFVKRAMAAQPSS